MCDFTIQYNSYGETFADSLYISKDREREICDIIEVCYEATESYPRAIEALSMLLDKPNEFAYALFHLGAFAGNEQAKREFNRATE